MLRSLYRAVHGYLKGGKINSAGTVGTIQGVNWPRWSRARTLGIPHGFRLDMGGGEVGTHYDA